MLLKSCMGLWNGWEERADSRGWSTGPGEGATVGRGCRRCCLVGLLKEVAGGAVWRGCRQRWLAVLPDGDGPRSRARCPQEFPVGSSRCSCA